MQPAADFTNIISLLPVSAHRAPSPDLQIQLALGDGPLRAGDKTTLDSLSLASIDYNAVRLRTQVR